MHELEAQGIAGNGSARLFDLRSRREIPLSSISPLMQQTQPGASGSGDKAAGVGRSLDDQLETFRRLAERQYPDDEAARSSYLVTLLEQRLREYASMFTRLEVRQQ